MNPNLATFIRMALAAAASFIIGKTFWGTPITSQLGDTIIASVMETIAIVWSLRDHTATIEKIQSAVRNFFTLAFGFLVSRGIISAEQSVMIIGAVGALATYLYSSLSKLKSTQLADPNNKLTIADLKTTSK